MSSAFCYGDLHDIITEQPDEEHEITIAGEPVWVHRKQNMTVVCSAGLDLNVMDAWMNETHAKAHVREWLSGKFDNEFEEDE